MEAETGSGKTEAALWRFLDLFEAGAVDGMYFALPTHVAATQAFARILRFADAAFGADRPAIVLAVPGQVQADGARGHKLPDFAFAWDDDPNDAVRQSRWAAAHPKRFLGAQIAVGTLDQALLGTIRTRGTPICVARCCCGSCWWWTRSMPLTAIWKHCFRGCCAGICRPAATRCYSPPLWVGRPI